MVKSYRDLIVWQRAMKLTLTLYEITKSFPKEELFGLSTQLRRAGVSVASNIAEGYGRNSTGEYKQMLGIARGSNLELQTQLLIASALGYSIPSTLKQAEELSIEVGKMLNSLISKL